MWHVQLQEYLLILWEAGLVSLASTVTTEPSELEQPCVWGICKLHVAACLVHGPSVLA